MTILFAHALAARSRSPRSAPRRPPRSPRRRGVLRVSAIPDEAPTELQRKFKPLGDYLKQETGMDVQFIPVTDYAAVVEGLATNKLDLAWLGGFTYVQARHAHQRRRRADRRSAPRTRCSRAASSCRSRSTAKTLADLKGKTFAFGSPSSTSGSLMPRYYLLQAGIDPERDFKSVAFSGAHDATVAFVAAGRAEAGVPQRLGAGQARRDQEPERREGARARRSRRPTSTTTGRCAPASTRR